MHPTKEGDRPRRRPKVAGAWAPEFAPELVALLVDITRRKGGLNDEKSCELLAIAIEPALAKRTNLKEKNRRVATLIRRLSEGRKRKRQ